MSMPGSSGQTITPPPPTKKYGSASAAYKTEKMNIKRFLLLLISDICLLTSGFAQLADVRIAPNGDVHNTGPVNYATGQLKINGAVVTSSGGATIGTTSQLIKGDGAGNGIASGLTGTALTTGFSLAGGTTSKIFTLTNTLTFSGTDGSALDIGTGGTLGNNAFNSTVFAPLASPTFTGVPAAPTAAVDTNTTQVATTAFVDGQAASANPVIDGTAAPGTSLRYARGDHVHPTDTTRAAAGANIDITSVLLNQTGLAVKGGSANALTIKPNETLSAARTLNIITGDASRTLTFTGDASVSGPNTGDQTITLTGNTTGSGAGSFATVTHGASQDWSFAGTLTPTALSSNQNDYSPASLATATSLRIDGGAADRNITGLAGGADGRIIEVVNIGTTNLLVFKEQNASSTAANRFLNGADVAVGPNKAVVLRYDGTSSRWRTFDRALVDTGVTVGSYGDASHVATFTVDRQGRLSAAGSTSIAIASGAVSGLAASATIDTTNAANITSGTLPIGQVPTGSTSTTVSLGNDTRFPASVTGLRNGAGAGSTDTAATIGAGLTFSSGTLKTTDGWTYVYLTSDFTTSGTGTVDVTGFVTGTLSATTLYQVEAALYITNAGDTAGCKFSLVSASSTNGVFIAYGSSTGTAQATGGSVFGNLSAGIFNTTSAGFAVVELQGWATTASGSPTVKLQAQKQTGGTCTIKAGSWLRSKPAGAP
jgi:hypothetical protein